MALAGAGIDNGFARPLAELLNGPPMEMLSHGRPHRTTLSQVGCRTLGDIRRLPRGGVSQRFDAALFAGLDRAEVHEWATLPDVLGRWAESQVDAVPNLEIFSPVGAKSKKSVLELQASSRSGRRRPQPSR
ncbi:MULTISPECIES: hypothetical protein [unclassified Variovorax]|uniref:hypothetical protein n=1 Tax=unclassified Variovorax TaxID=663243 RepID=UPI003ED01F01